MQNRKQLNIHDLLQDESFHAWALGAGNALAGKWERYFLEYPDQLYEAEEARRLINAIRFQKMELPEELVGAERVRLTERISQNDKAGKSVNALTDAWKRNRLFFLTFPFILAVFILGAYYISLKFISPPPLIWQEIFIPDGTRSMVVLPDSSRVWMNAGSTLKYPDRFEEQKEVYLAGEAYFEIRHGNGKPLTVHADKIDLQTNGADFNLSAYLDDNPVEATLLDGSLLISRSNPAQKVTRLLPDQKAVFLVNSDSMRIEHVRSVDYRGWSRGMLTFNGESLARVIRRTERWFAIKIMPVNELKGENRYYGSFKSKSPEHVMNELLKGYPYRYYRMNDTLFVQKRRR